MAPREIHFTFGPKEALKKLIQAHPDRKLLLFQAVTDKERYMLFDYSGQETIFSGGLSYQVVRQVEFDKDWDGFFEFRYLTLDEDEQKVFRAIMDKWVRKDGRPFGLNETVILQSEKKNFEFLMINVWEAEADFVDWTNLKDNELQQFGNAGNDRALVVEYKRAK